MKKFQWDMSSIQQKINERNEQNEPIYAFRINLNSGYHLGSGMSENDYKKYIIQMKLNLTSKGYSVRDGNTSSSSMEIRGGGSFYCYLHPSEWSGYGTQKFINDLLSALGKMNCVQSFDIRSKKELLPLAPYEYEELILANVPNLIPFFEQNEKQLHYSSTDMGFEFAKQYRLPIIMRYEHSVEGYSSNDLDISMIQTIYKTYHKMKEMGIIDLSELNKSEKQEPEYDEPDR